MKTALATTMFASLAAGCMTGSDADAPLSYEQFRAKYVMESTTPSGRKVLVYDWDQPLRSEAQVRALYDAYAAAKIGGATLSEATVNSNVFGELDIWSADQAQNLTYCVSDSFGALKKPVIDAMNSATAAWSNAANGKIRYVYQPQYDASCNTATPVVFDVNPGANAYASAFFPSYPRDQRSVLIHPATFNGTFPADGILRHELGHTLGLRHETTRIDAVVEYGWQCFENIWHTPLTEYDNTSVMTTPACMGANIINKTLSLSSLDVQGIQALYY